MVQPWEHEVRLYPPDDEDHARRVPRRLVAACTCGDWAREWDGSIDARTVWQAIAEHEDYHASLRPALDPLVAVEVVNWIRDRGGRVAPGKCRYCKRRITLEPVGYPVWVANPPDPEYPVMYCPGVEREQPGAFPCHSPALVTELVAQPAPFPPTCTADPATIECVETGCPVHDPPPAPRDKVCISCAAPEGQPHGPKCVTRTGTLGGDR